jgi:hypothetical protein
LHSPPKEKYNHTKGPLKSNFSDFSTSIAWRTNASVGIMCF